MEEGRRFSALYSIEYRKFYLAQIVNFTGSWLHNAAQGWLVYTLTESAFYLGLLGVVMSLPVLLFTLIGGFLADRFNKRILIIISQSSLILPILILAILTQLDLVKVWHIFVLAFITGTINAVDIPVRQSFIIEMVGKRRLLNAIAFNSTAFNGARALGPLIAGLLIQFNAMPACFFLNAFSYLPIIYVLTKMKPEGWSHNRKSKKKGNHFLDGFFFIRKNRNISGMILTVSIFSIFGIPINQFLPIFADKIFRSGVEGYSYLSSAMGIGALAGGLIIAYKGFIHRTGAFLTITGICFPVSVMLFSMVREFYTAMLLLIIAGWSIVSFFATSNSFVQLHADDHIRGRVMSIYTLMFLGMTPIGHFMIGYVADKIGVNLTVCFSSVICFTGFMILRKRWI